MLVLSMMSGVFSLSASADEEQLNPVVVNRPTLTFKDFINTDDEYLKEDAFDQTCYDDIWKRTLNTICVNLDDTNSVRKTSEINRVTYTYHDETVEFTDEAFFKTVDSFGLILVDTPLNYHASHIIDGKWSDKITSYYFPTNYRTTKEDYIYFLNAIAKAKITLNIYYNDNEAPYEVETKVYSGGVSQFYRNLKNDHIGGTAYSCVLAINLSNSNKTAHEAFSDLDNAIKDVQIVSDNAVSRLYVDIDSEKPIVLPMSDISPSAELVQTRVGDSIVYNSKGSVNYGENTHNEQSENDGNIYLLPNGSYSSDDDLVELTKYIWQNGYNYRYYVLDNTIYEIYGFTLTQIPNFKDGYLVKYVDNYYKNFSGSTNSVIDNFNSSNVKGNSFKSSSPTACWFSGNLNRFRLSINYTDTNSDKSRLFMEKLEELSQNLSDSDTQWLNYLRISFSYSYEYKYKNNSSIYYSGSGTSFYWMDNYSENIKYRDYYFKPGVANDYQTNNGSYEYYNITSTNIDSIYFNTSYDTLPSAAFMKKLVEIINEVGFDINYNASYYPDINGFITADESNKIYISDILDELNIQHENGKNQVMIGNLNYFGSNGNTMTTVNRPQSLHETYELGALGDFVTDTQRNTSGFVTDTLDDNGNITFNYDDVKDNVTKGKVYNVVNQIQIPVIDTTGNNFYETPQIWYNSDMNAVNDKSLGYTCIDSETGEKVVKGKGNVYYLGGDNIVSSNTAYITDGNSEYGILRNTEYKWGEIVFVSKPDSVQNLTFNSDAQTLTWSKPVDEGYGTTEGQTNTDDYIKVDEYIVKIKDSGGNVVLTKNVPRTQEDTVAFKIENLHLKNDNYTAEVTAKNVIGESVPAETPLDLRMPEVEITMTPDQPIYQIDDTVTFSECVANTGRVPLTNVVVTQSVDGEYTAKNGVKINGNTAAIETLDIGQRVQLEYKTPASVEVMNVIRNTAEVTTNENASDSVSSTVTVIKPGLSMVTTADKDIYKDGDTVTLTTVVTNTGNEAIKDVEVKFDVESGKFTKCDTNTTKLSENDTTAMIGVLPVGESTTLTYEIKAENIETGKNAAAEIVSTAKTTDKKLTAASVVNFTVSRPDLTISANADEELVVYGDDVVYTVVVTNSGNCTLKNITVSSDSKGAFAENEAGSINKTGNFVLAELTEGKSVTLVYTVPAKNTAVGKFTSTFKANDDKNNSAADKAEAEVLNYKVNILKLTDDSEHYLGEDILFRGIVTNRGNYELNNITVIEDLKGRFELADGAKTAGDNVIVIDSLMPGESYTYDYYVTASEDIIKDGKITGTASADAGNNIKSSDMKSVTVYSPALTVEKTTDNETVYKVGDTVEWIDVITNTGDCTLNNVVVTENFIGRFDTTEYDTNGNTLNIPKLEAGDSVTVKYITDIRQGDLSSSTYTSKIYVSADEKISETAAASVKVTGPAFRITKYADKETYFPKDEIIFTDAIINVGDKKLTNVTVTEDLEGEFTRIGEGFKAKGNTIVIPEIDVGDSAVVYFSVNRDSLTEKTVTSIVTVTCDQEISDNADVTFTLANDTNTDSEKSNTDTSNTDSGMDNTDTSNTDSGMDNTDTGNTDSGMDNTDTSNTDSGKDNTDTSNTDSGKDNTDTSNTDSGKDNTDTSNTDSGKDNTDTSNTDSGKDNTDTSNTDSGKDNTDTSKQTDTDTSGKASNDQPDKESEDQPAKMLMGDVNLDNKITARDSLLIQRYAIGLESFNDLQLLLGDVSGNNKVSTGDALNILRYTVKLATQSSTGTLIDIPNDLRAYISK